MNPEQGQEQPKLTKNQLRRLRAQQAQQEQERINRRQAIRKGILWFAGTSATAAAAVGGVIALQASSRSRNGSAEPSTEIVPMSAETKRMYEEYKLKEAKLAQVLQRTDTAVLWLRENLTPRLEAYSEVDKMSLLAPINIYENNQTNPDRNKYSLLKRDLETRGDVALRSEIQNPIGDIRHFYLEILGEVPLAAGFSPPDKTVHLNERFDPNNLFDVLVLYHELEHVEEDTEFRKGITTPRALEDYMNFYRTDRRRRPRVIGAWEQEAYLKEIFVMDTLMEGRVRADVANGGFNADQYLRALNTPPSNRQAIEMLFGFAQSIYNSNSNLSYFAPTYAETVNTHYRRDQGYDIYQLTPDRRLELVP